MKRAATIALALGAVIGAGLSPAAAQVVIGGSDQPDVQVNWSVLERLGPAPTLADMLKADIPATPMRSALAPAVAKPEPITFRPYAEPKKTVARKPAPAVAKAEPAAAPSPDVAELREAAEAIRAETKPAPAAASPKEVAKAEPAKTEPVKPAAAPARPPKPDVAEQGPAAPQVPPSAPPAAVASSAPPAAVASSAPPAAVASSAPPAAVASSAPPAAVASAKAPEAAAPAVAPPESIKPAPATTAAPAPTPVVAQAAPAAAPATPGVPVAPAVATAAPAASASTPTPSAPVVSPVPAPAAQVATLPSPAPAAASSGGDTMSILFTGDAARLPETARPALEKLAARLEKDEGLGLQLLAYADGDDASASKARRLSLSRALEVRKFLMDQGVRSTRIEVRALGNKSDGGPADRVDAILIAR